MILSTFCAATSCCHCIDSARIACSSFVWLSAAGAITASPIAASAVSAEILVLYLISPPSVDRSFLRGRVEAGLLTAPLWPSTASRLRAAPAALTPATKQDVFKHGTFIRRALRGSVLSAPGRFTIGRGLKAPLGLLTKTMPDAGLTHPPGLALTHPPGLCRSVWSIGSIMVEPRLISARRGLSRTDPDRRPAKPSRPVSAHSEPDAPGYT